MIKVPKLFVGMPARGYENNHYSTVAFLAASQKYPMTLQRSRSSLLTFNFNTLWAQALNEYAAGNATHFAMIHDDVVPDKPGWADTLITLLDRNKADVVSAIVPIKNQEGLTSTALEDSASGRAAPLSLKDVFGMPPTFGTESPRLLVNTGLWVCRMGDWCEKVWFKQTDKVVKENGKWEARALSEDWDFSMQLHELGRSVYATREVQLYHGSPNYHNRFAWGTTADKE